MLKLLLGDPNARKLKRYQPIVSDIQLLEEEIAPRSDDELRGKTAAFKERLANAGSLANQRPILDEILPEAFAVVREAGKGVLGMRHFDVTVNTLLSQNRHARTLSCHSSQFRDLCHRRYVDAGQSLS